MSIQHRSAVSLAAMVLLKVCIGVSDASALSESYLRSSPVQYPSQGGALTKREKNASFVDLRT
jgi:hypothetical protein